MLIENYYWLDYLNVSNLSGHAPLGKNPIGNFENLTARKTIIAPEFERDVKALCEYARILEICPGISVHITLQEILKIAPRKRARIDSYSKLVNYLKDRFGVA